MSNADQTPGVEPAIELDGVAKRYVLHKQKPFLMKEIAHRLLGRGASHDEFWAVDDFSLKLKGGGSVGIVGHNGAGKSTLLGLIAGTINPTRGSVTVRGRVGTLLELGAGFHPDLTGRENIYLNAALLGLRREEIESRFEDIVEFSELQEFIDVALGNYSSGMKIRLGFSVAVHIDPDILIMDEVLAVGDADFQQKCVERIEQFKEDGKTLLFVSHNMSHVESLCDWAVWLDHGKVKDEGPSEEIAEKYMLAAKARRIAMRAQQQAKQQAMQQG